MKSCISYHRFQFYATIGGFSSGENCVSAAVNHTIYGASTKLLLSVKGFCVFKISVIVHNRYCVKCSLLHSWLYWYLPEKSCHLLADSSINNLADHDRTGWSFDDISRRYFILVVSFRSFTMVQMLWKRRIRASILNYNLIYCNRSPD